MAADLCRISVKTPPYRSSDSGFDIASTLGDLLVSFLREIAMKLLLFLLIVRVAGRNVALHLWHRYLNLLPALDTFYRSILFSVLICFRDCLGQIVTREIEWMATIGTSNVHYILQGPLLMLTSLLIQSFFSSSTNEQVLGSRSRSACFVHYSWQLLYRAKSLRCRFVFGSGHMPNEQLLSWEKVSKLKGSSHNQNSLLKVGLLAWQSFYTFLQSRRVYRTGPQENSPTP